MGIRMETFRGELAGWDAGGGGQLVESRGLKEEAPISGSTVSFPVFWVCLGVRVLLAKLPDTCRCLGKEGGRQGEKEGGRKRGRERRAEGQLVSGLQGCQPSLDFLPLVYLGAAEPLSLLCGVGGSRLPYCVVLGKLPLFCGLGVS